jgi:hypothetical protein
MPLIVSRSARQISKLLTLALAASLCGCGTYGGEQVFVVGPEHLRQDDPVRASFAVKGGFNYEQIWKAAQTAMSNGMNVIESHKPSGVIKSRVGAAPSGKVVGFWITPTTPNASQYSIHTLSVKPIGFTSLNGKAWEPKVVDDFNAALSAK